MEEHKGRVLERVIRKKGINISQLAKKIGVNRRSLYNYFQEKNLKSIVFEKIAAAINYDFMLEYPNILIGEPSIQGAFYGPKMAQDVDYWKNKYISLLERHVEVLSGDDKD